jgi:hypothetical protein
LGAGSKYIVAEIGDIFLLSLSAINRCEIMRRNSFCSYLSSGKRLLLVAMFPSETKKPFKAISTLLIPHSVLQIFSSSRISEISNSEIVFACDFV